MPILPPPPDSVDECQLVRVLRQKSTATDGAIDKATRFIEVAAPMVDLIISGPFRQYTLHNRDHSKKLLYIAEHIVPAATIEALSPLEHLVCIYAAFLHDMGMAVTETERNRILSSDEFQDVVQASGFADALNRARKRVATAADQDRFAIDAEIYQLQEAALASFLRPRHASPDRYRQLISGLKNHSNRPDLFEYRGVSFEEILIEICVSHNLDAGVLTEARGPYQQRFPRQLAIGGAYLNAQFSAALLRLTDVLDFDRERTPEILFNNLGIAIRSLPGAEVSVREWQKHMAVHTLEINPEEVVVSAETHHPVIEKAIRDFCAVIEREIRDTLPILKQNESPIATRYVVELPVNVRPQVRAVGYVFKDMSLKLNQPRIMALLMGDRLYSEPAAAVRELIQNSIDACSARERLSLDTYVPEIAVTASRDATDRWWLEVSDNGCGMDEHILSEYFLTVGNSYYSSPEFARVYRTASSTVRAFVPISRFGIGLVATFLIGDVLEVVTRSAYSPRHDYIQRHLRIERLGALAFVTERESQHSGTQIRLRISPEFNDNFGAFERQVSEYLQRVILRPQYPIKVNLPDARLTLFHPPGFVLKANADELLASAGYEAVLLDIERWSDRISGSVCIVFSKTGQGLLAHLRDGHYVRLGAAGLAPDKFLDQYGGNRLTVNGFKMAIKKASHVLGNGKNRLALAFDLELRGDKDIEYDISRQRVVGSGRLTIMRALEAAIRDGLRDTGVMDRLDPLTRNVLDDTHKAAASTEGFGWYRAGFVDDQDLLDRIAALVPDGPWPKDMHKAIAERLAISKNVAVRGINTLLKAGRIEHKISPP